MNSDRIINMYSTFYIATGWLSDAGNVVSFRLKMRGFFFIPEYPELHFLRE
jgi:hypothetical protein